MNTTVNKLYHLNKQIGLEVINLGFVHFKKLMKIQFLKMARPKISTESMVVKYAVDISPILPRWDGIVLPRNLMFPMGDCCLHCILRS